MKLKPSELSLKIGVGKSTVSNWINRDKKLVINKNGLIDTENSLNKEFLSNKAPYLYNNGSKKTILTPNITFFKPKTPASLFGNKELYDENKDLETLPETFNIDDLTELEAKSYLKIISSQDPKLLLISAQYRRASVDAELKNIQLQEKINSSFDRDFVIAHFIGILNTYYINRRQIPFNTIDEIISLILEYREGARNKVVEILDEKFLSEIEDAQNQLEILITKKYPLSEIQQLPELNTETVAADDGK